ncbi:MAG: exonuclease domain-containing protein [Lachnospiraceae bacterium]|jgi:inhibitor of KinA sporulation pathway (predicted exonuclease)|nr:exonuclease domain-containing protein [Lachnospiraceae bacterium]
MNYIVLDLEWNQCPGGKAKEKPGLPFEIVEIGAMKLSEDRKPLDSFNEMIRPQIYRKFHYRTKEIVHMDMEELQRARTFPEVAKDFLAWCGEDCCFCTWGPLDLMELQRNMKFYRMRNPLPFPLLYYDVQKLFSLLYEDGKSRRSLEDAVNYLKIEKDMPFHRAFDDTYYTAAIMRRMDWEQIAVYRSVDYYRLPSGREDEIHLNFGRYAKYVSRSFGGREAALRDKEVVAARCYECGAQMKRLIPWFASGSRQYLSLNRCPEHGLVKGKLRLKKTMDDRMFVVKTLKQIGEEEAALIRGQHENAKKKG